MYSAFEIFGSEWRLIKCIILLLLLLYSKAPQTIKTLCKLICTFSMVGTIHKFTCTSCFNCVGDHDGNCYFGNYLLIVIFVGVKS